MRDLMNRPETELALLCARDKHGDRELALARRLISKCEDPAGFARCCIGGKIPMQTENLLQHEALCDAGSFVQDARGILAGRCDWWRNLRPHQEELLQQIRHAFNAGKIDFIVVRGIPFAEKYYAKPHLRTSFDIDLLVRESQRGDAAETLQALSFEYKEENLCRQARGSYMGQAEFIKTKDGRQLEVDLNWRLTGNTGIGNVTSDMDGVWQRATPLNGNEFAFAADDEFFEHVRHYAQGHDFGNALLQTCCDLSAFAATDGHLLDPERIYSLAQTTECTRAIALFLTFLDEHYFADDPETDRSSSPLEVLDPLKRLVSPVNKPAFSVLLKSNLLLNCKAEGRLTSAAKTWRALAAKMACLDRIRRSVRLIKTLIYPSPPEFVLLTGGQHPNARNRTLWLARISALVPCLVVGIPLGILGILADKAWLLLQPKFPK